METSLFPGVALYTLLALTPVLMLLAISRLHPLPGRARVVLIRLHLWRREPLVPAGPPLEQLAADLRRLYAGAHFPQKGVRMPKQRGILMAYDHHLVETAQALEVPTTLPDLPAEGFDREVERLRLEHALTEAGLVWQLRADWPRDPAA
jgi:hypothetical protein